MKQMSFDQLFIIYNAFLIFECQQVSKLDRQ